MSRNMTASIRVNLSLEQAGDYTSSIVQLQRLKAAGQEVTLIIRAKADQMAQATEVQKQFADAGQQSVIVISEADSNVTALAASLGMLADSAEKTAAATKKAKEEVQKFSVSANTASDLSSFTAELDKLAGFTPEIKGSVALKQTGEDYEALAQQALDLDSHVKNLSVSLRTQGQDVQGLAEYVKILRDNNIKLAVSYDAVQKQVRLGSYSTRRLVFDLRMLSFAARTLQRQFAQDNEQLKQITDTMVVFSATATGMVVSVSMLSQAGKALGLSAFHLAQAGGSMTAMLIAAAPAVLALTAVIVAAYAAWQVWQHALQSRAGWRAAQNSIDMYTNELERLETELKAINKEQAKLNEETSRYGLLSAQIEYAAALQGYETEEQKGMLDYLRIAEMGASLENQRLQYQETINQRRTGLAQEQIDLAEQLKVQERNDLLREILGALTARGRVYDPITGRGIPQYKEGTIVPETGPALVHAGELITPRHEIDRMNNMEGGPVQVHVNFPNANFGTPEQARQAAEQAAFILGSEVQNRMSMLRYGNRRP
jgi:uncharacterized protein (UPF0335 family)